MSVMKRGNQWCLRRRVPVEFRSVESRAEIWISLQTDCLTSAPMGPNRAIPAP
ncbi:DUF6538 domain-containing protein [Aliiroseovarius lamellibrachiae]|uniref:DUF6538 domain-containing protein n=1 Tax=Aliiroseovarius lamellibrachiae TaxID=1924933 RepID=UPI0031B83FC2